MIVTIVNVSVKPEHITDFITASAENHENSLREPGNLRFDVLQSLDDPSRFFLYEAYISEEDAALHKAAPHYLKWRDTVAPWMEKPREGIPCKVISPIDPERW